MAGKILYIESEILELKEKYTDAIVRDIIAFLNTHGGEIYVGITDCGEIKGIPDNQMDETQKKISDCITSQIEPNPQAEITTTPIKEKDKNILRISVGKGFKPIYCIKKYGFSSKGCLVRIGTT